MDRLRSRSRRLRDQASARFGVGAAEFGEPRTRRSSRQATHELAEYEPGVTGDLHVHTAVAAKRAWIDVDLHDLGLRVPARGLTVREHEVEARADDEHGICGAQSLRADGSDVVRMVVGHDAASGMGDDHRGTEVLDERDQLVRSA